MTIILEVNVREAELIASALRRYYYPSDEGAPHMVLSRKVYQILDEARKANKRARIR